MPRRLEKIVALASTEAIISNAQLSTDRFIGYAQSAWRIARLRKCAAIQMRLNQGKQQTTESP
jgi:hypothetical protein